MTYTSTYATLGVARACFEEVKRRIEQSGAALSDYLDHQRDGSEVLVLGTVGLVVDLDAPSVPDDSRLVGELYIGADDSAHFISHVKDTDFQSTREMLLKFIDLLQDQIKRQGECPYYEQSEPPAILLNVELTLDGRQLAERSAVQVLGIEARAVRIVVSPFKHRLETYARAGQVQPAEVNLLDCPNCKAPGIPEGHGRSYDFCLRCGWSDNLTEGPDQTTGLQARAPFEIDRTVFLADSLCSECRAAPGEHHLFYCSKSEQPHQHEGGRGHHER